MIAARLHSFGTPADALRVEPITLPPPAPGEVQLAMLHAPINPADMNIIAGTYGELPELPATIGNEGAGRVIAVGENVTSLQPGDLTAVLARGTWCSHRNVSANDVVRLPSGCDARQAAMLGVNPPTALAMLREIVDLQPGDWVVQNAANSGVGRSVIPLARHLGFRTLNVVRRPELIEELRSLGADCVVTEETDLRKTVMELTGGARARLALNAVGGASALNIANALADGGTHVTYGAMSRQALKIPNGLLIFRQMEFRGFWLRRWLAEGDVAKRRAAYEFLAERIADRTLGIPVAAEFPLREIHAALDAATLEKRSGKILLDLSAE